MERVKEGLGFWVLGSGQAALQYLMQELFSVARFGKQLKARTQPGSFKGLGLGSDSLSNGVQDKVLRQRCQVDSYICSLV